MRVDDQTPVSTLKNVNSWNQQIVSRQSNSLEVYSMVNNNNSIWS
jgi:hypothetical protein